MNENKRVRGGGREMTGSTRTHLARESLPSVLNSSASRFLAQSRHMLMDLQGARASVANGRAACSRKKALATGQLRGFLFVAGRREFDDGGTEPGKQGNASDLPDLGPSWSYWQPPRAARRAVEPG